MSVLPLASAQSNLATRDIPAIICGNCNCFVKIHDNMNVFIGDVQSLSWLLKYMNGHYAARKTGASSVIADSCKPVKSLRIWG